MKSRSIARVLITGLVSVAVLATLLPIQATPALATGDPIKYVHDEAGRLVGVIDADGSAARYSYDKVGNITAIDRFAATDLSIIEFTPNSGPASTAVTIWGTGYSSTPGNNAVAFNGSSATVTSASENKLVVTLPSGATTGTITVTVGSSTATSQDPFTVASGSGQPTITGFSPPAVVPGDQLTITGTNFETDAASNVVKLGGGVRGGTLSATTTQLTILVPENVKGGTVSVTTPAGTATSTNDLYASPPGYTGPVIQSAERMSIGDIKTVSVPTSSKVVMVVFDATQGQKISLVSDTSAQMSTAIYNPDGTYLTPPVYPAFPEPPPLTQTGTYTIVVDPRPYNRTGSVTLKLYSVPADVTGQIAIDGSAVTFSTTVPGQNAAFTFSGTQGQRLSFSGQLCQPFTIKKPDGTALVSGSSSNCSDIDLDPLPVTGTYTIYIDPQWSSLASNMWMLLSSPVTGTMSPGTPVSVNLSRSGQNAYLTFAGTAGQKISMTNQPTTQMFTSILKPDGTTLSSASYWFQEPKVLPVTGTYTVVVNPPSGHTGSTTLKLYDVPADLSGTLSVSAAPVQIQTTTPGQNASYTFDETQGHAMSLAGCISNWTLYKPSGGSLASGTSYGCGNVEFSSLPETGTYRLLLDPQSETLMNKEVTISEPITGSLTIGGGSVSKTISRSGQNVRMTFDGTASQHVNLTVSGLQTLTPVTLYKPDGSSLASGQSSSTVTLNNVTLPTTGTYSVLIDPYDGNQTSATFTVIQTPGTIASARRRAGPPSRDRIPAPDYRRRPPRPHRAVHSPARVDTRPKNLETMRLRRLARNLARSWHPSTSEVWVPSRSDLHGNFRSDREASPWTTFPARQAARGETALAGQVLTLNGRPLRNVTLEVDGVEAKTDFAGRFLLEGVESGHEELEIEGDSASHGKRTYGFFEAGVDILEGRTNVLDYTIWMPRLDTKHEVWIPKVTKHETVVTTPKIPGLELHIPAGKTIEDEDEDIVHRVGITAIPVDRPPFPLPKGVEVPIYFTIQPGGSYIEPYDEATGDGAQLIYPNYTHAPVGTRVNFWNYDPEDEGWYIYGNGTVTQDGKQVVPDKGVAIYEFTGAMIANWPPGAPQPAGTGPVPGGATDGEPVDLATGLFVMKKTDLYLPDTIPISLTRTYRQSDPAIRAFGVGMGLDYNMVLSTNAQYTYGELILPDGGRIRFNRINSGNGATDGIFEAQSTPTDFYKARLSWDGSRWNLVKRDGTTYVFGQDTPLLAIRDRFGNQVTISRQSGALGLIKQITSPNGRWIRPTYDSRNRISKATDNAGRVVNYTYGTSDRLASVADAKGGTTQYGWDSSNRMTTIQDPRQLTFLTNEYGSGSRLVKQTQADGTTYNFAYTTNSAGAVTQTDVTDPRGIVRRVVFDSAGYPTSDTHALGTTEENAVTYVRDATTSRVQSTTDELGRKTAFTYDAAGNPTTVTRLADTAGANSTSFTYDATYSTVTSVTDPRQETTDFVYDSLGRLTSTTDATGVETTFGYTSAGLLASVTNGADEETTYSYSGGDLVGITDPLGRSLSRFVDSAGRVISATDAKGNTTRFAYDALNLQKKVTDPLGGVTQFDYDANGNLTTITDAKNHVSSYTYDSMDRLATRTDALQHSESYAYDGNGNLTGFTDRRGTKTTYAYDSLNRKIFAGFGTTGTSPSLSYESTTDFTYDGGSRLGSVEDSVGGTIAMVYDDMDRLTTEESPEGEVAYTYDEAGRRATMTVDGQGGVSYDYDAANRLTGVHKGSNDVSIAYDSAGRRDAVTLPDGIVQDYEYNAGSEVVSIEYALGNDQLGDLSYAYDATGRTKEVSGSFGRVDLPVAVSNATYDNGNRLTQWGNKSFSYDLNGNLTSDGTEDYTFDERNQLSNIEESNATVASYQYDGLGRRAERTVDGVSRRYLYDGLNPIQELNGTGAVTANLLAGLGVDEYYSRTSSSSDVSILTDKLGSAVATADSSGSIETEYTYTPFGKTSATGATSVLDFQYTGRENDGNGLQFSRARYYQPSYGRFASEDPLREASGQSNLFSYVSDNPVDMRDPLGLCGWTDPLGCVTDAVSAVGDALATVGRKFQAVAGLVADIASVVAIIPGPIGMWASGIAAVGYAINGEWANAALSATGMVLGKISNYVMAEFKAANAAAQGYGSVAKWVMWAHLNTTRSAFAALTSALPIRRWFD
jgi:RHS repeat-associated protein